MVKTILLTEPKCNFHCEYCYYNHNSDYKNPGFKRDIILDNIKKDIEKWGSKESRLYFLLWGGEPTLNKYFREVVEMIRGVSREVGIFTASNGSTLTDDLISFLKENDVWIAISNDLIYQDIRNGEYFLIGTDYGRQIAKGIREGVVRSIQTVWSESSWNLQEQYEYLQKFFKENNLNPVHWKILPYQAYSEEDVCNSIHSERALNSFKKWILSGLRKEVTNAPEPEPTSSSIDKEVKRIALGFSKIGWNDFYKETHLSKDDNPQCVSYDLNNQVWDCKDTYLSEESPVPVPVEHQYDYCFEVECPYFGICKGICSGKTTEHRKLNCDSIKKKIDTVISAYKEYYESLPKEKVSPPEVSFSVDDISNIENIEIKSSVCGIKFKIVEGASLKDINNIEVPRDEELSSIESDFLGIGYPLDKEGPFKFKKVYVKSYGLSGNKIIYSDIKSYQNY